MLPSLDRYRGLDLTKLWSRSKGLLRSAIAIPVFIKMDENQIRRTVSTIRNAIGQI
jgi:hypothetical protein